MGEFWWTVDEDMFTYVMKSRIEELIEEKLNQEFPAEVEIRDNQDIESDEEMTSETGETDNDSEPNNEKVNNYLSAMKLAEEEDLRIGDSGASSHMMGSEEQEVLQGYCWVQRRHPEQMKRLIERMKTTVINEQK